MEQTDSSRRGGGQWMKEGAGMSQRTRRYKSETQTRCGDGLRAGGWGGETGTCNSVNNKGKTGNRYL